MLNRTSKIVLVILSILVCAFAIAAFVRRKTILYNDNIATVYYDQSLIQSLIQALSPHETLGERKISIYGIIRNQKTPLIPGYWVDVADGTVVWGERDGGNDLICLINPVDNVLRKAAVSDSGFTMINLRASIADPGGVEVNRIDTFVFVLTKRSVLKQDGLSRVRIDFLKGKIVEE